MVDWIDYMDQSRVDLKACQLLFGASDFGNAAYHLQQSVEKHVKAVLYHSGKIKVKRVHIPFDFAEELLLSFEQIDILAKKHKVTLERDAMRQAQESFIPQLKQLVVELKNNPERAKVALWKMSLGMSFEATEQEFFARYPMFTMYYRMPMTIEGSMVGEGIDQFMVEVNTDPSLAMLKYYITATEYSRLLAATWPHEDIGRYPTDIPFGNAKESSVVLYGRHKDKLWGLIDAASRILEIWKKYPTRLDRGNQPTKS